MIKDWTQTEIIALIEDIHACNKSISEVNLLFEKKSLLAVVILYSPLKREYAIAVIQNGLYHETKDVNEGVNDWTTIMHIDLDPRKSMEIRHRWINGGQHAS